MNKALFLDRDGIINRDHAYVYRVEDFEFMPGIFEVCKHFQEQGYKLIVVTNQSGIARGYYTEEDFHILTKWMCAEFEKQQIRIDGVYFCPHHPDKGNAPYVQDCDCRKPHPGMLLQAITDHQLDPSVSVMIGDKVSDMQAAQAAGLKSGFLILSEEGELPKLSQFGIQKCEGLLNCLANIKH